ncbi:hypothetical protein GUJ93_ZPchr0007g5539 [Zizania palustris]|uniref:Uncharacterized protein n=1 Tax=Zizania palustris TaxID=103762 RepID=A0A8J5SS99_ZIZPA|nr:hypothetical protein GUJ93_ZPchr0007g5539 [Zizania palustris]
MRAVVTTRRARRGEARHAAGRRDGAAPRAGRTETVWRGVPWDGGIGQSGARRRWVRGCCKARLGAARR